MQRDGRQTVAPVAEIHGRIDGPSGTLWESTQPVTQKCSASAPVAPKPGKPIKAKFSCKKILKDQSSWAIGTEGYKIDAERIDCTLSTREQRAQGSTAVIRTVWSKGGVVQPSRDRMGDANSEDDFQWYITLEKGSDWDVCAPELIIPVTLTNMKGELLFTAQEKYLQNCAAVPVAPPVGSVKPSADGAKWDSGALERIPQDARSTAQAFIDAVVDSDPPALSSMGSRGVKLGKKVLKGKDLYDPSSLGLKPQLGCEAGACKWGGWVSVAKGPSEFWVFSTNDSGYGSFAAAVFSKSGAEWRWTAVRTYETGEP